MKLLSVTLLIFVACTATEPTVDSEVPVAGETAAATSTPAPSSLSTDAPQNEHTVHVGSRFTPDSIAIPAGEAVRIHFTRGEDATCADQIVFPDLGVKKSLAANETITVDLPPQPAGSTLAFACGMDMMKGSVVAR